MVMQDVGHQLFTDSVEAECRLGMKTADNNAVNQALEWLDLTPYKDRHPLSLSGGQKQRLAVAVSLVCEKDLLIFDEPTSGLDLKSMLEVGRLARELSVRGKSCSSSRTIMSLSKPSAAEFWFCGTEALQKRS